MQLFDNQQPLAVFIFLTLQAPSVSSQQQHPHSSPASGEDELIG
jgi:hypothetical protein